MPPLDDDVPAPSQRQPQAGAADGEVVRLGGGAAAAASLPTIAPAPPFRLFFDAAQWMVSCGKIVPMLHHAVLQHGLNGARLISLGNNQPPRLDPGPAIEFERRQGRIEVLQEWAPNGVSYMKRHQVVGGVRYCTVWEKLFPGVDRSITDRKGYAAWLESLIATGKLPPPSVVALYSLRANYSAVVDSLQQMQDRQPRNKKEAERLAKDLEIIEAAIAKLENDSD